MSNTTRKKQKTNNLDILKINNYYDKFLQRYKYQLSLNQTVNSLSLDERFDAYTNIINNIVGEKITKGHSRVVNYNNYNNNNNNKPSNAVLESGNETDKLKYYTIKIIKKILKVKTNITINPTFKQMSCISLHGGCTTKYFKIPNNLIICLLTPLNRVSIISNLFINTLIENIQQRDFNTNFLNNPSCYLRDTEYSLLQFATIFYPGQMCNDLVLSIDPREKNRDNGYYKFDLSNPSNPSNLSNHTIVPDTNIDEKLTNNTTLSSFIKYKQVSGVLFVHCCRSCDLDVSLIPETQKIYILETFTNVLNKTIDNPEDIKYYKCNLLLYKNSNIAPRDRITRKIRNLANTNVPNPKLLQTLRNIGKKTQKQLQTNTATNKSLSPISQSTFFSIKDYYNALLINDTFILDVKNILKSNITDKEKYEEFNKFLYVYKLLGLQDINALFKIFNKSLDYNENNAINYLCSYVYYYFIIIVNSNINILKSFLNKNKMTTLYLSGDISYQNIIKMCLFLQTNKILITYLNISDNKNLMSLDFVSKLSTLEKIDAHNCNILFVEESVLDLNNLKEINLDENKNLSFNKHSIIGNTKEEEDYIVSHVPSKMLSYDDISFKTHPKYSIFLKYLIDYNLEYNSGSNNVLLNNHGSMMVQ